MHSLSYQQKKYISFRVRKHKKKHPLSRFLLLVFLPLSQKRREKHSYNLKCGCSREKKNLWFSCTFINFKEEMYVHMQAWNTVNKHSNIMSCAGLMLHTTTVQRGWEERKKTNNTNKGMTSWYKKKYSLSCKQVKHPSVNFKTSVFITEGSLQSTQRQKQLFFHIRVKQKWSIACLILLSWLDLLVELNQSSFHVKTTVLESNGSW